MSVIEIDQDDHVRYVRLNRPDKMNALSDELAWGIVEAVRSAQADEATWVIGITGSGRAFCAGLDLVPDGDGGSDGDGGPHPSGMNDQDLFLDDLHWVSRLTFTLREECDKPIVAGINGVAVGAGLALAMGCDVRIMAESARLMAGYPRIGASPDGGLSWTLPQAMGYEQALRFLLENRTVLGPEAKELGLVGEVVADDQLESRFRSYCTQLTTISPITARLSKRVVRAATRHQDLEAHLRYELGNIQKAFASNDGKEARQAFLDKRPPTFTGR